MLQAWHIVTFAVVCTVHSTPTQCEIHPQWFGCDAFHSTVLDTPILLVVAPTTATATAALARRQRLMAGWLWINGFENVALPLRCSAFACVQNIQTFSCCYQMKHFQIRNTNPKAKRPTTSPSTFQTANRGKRADTHARSMVRSYAHTTRRSHSCKGQWMRLPF